ncbi:MAG TPA: response regulator transcription factor [Ktedonobacteraceae bacterium]|nr:response regulator transcription factor [Ktedonobacteraceae bacterium]
MKILIIEDETNIAQIIKLYLEQANFTTFIASDGVAGLEMHAREHPDLVILDLMLPALDGMEVCRRIRAWANTPILMLTARQSEDDRIAGLELGADDYLVKPFSPREVVSRVKAILRRTSAPGQLSTLDGASETASGYMGFSTAGPASLPDTHTGSSSLKVEPASRESRGQVDRARVEELRYGALRINIPARRVEVNSHSVTLTAKEFDVLVTLASAPDRVFTRETLLDKIWGYTFLGDGRTVDVHIGTLRKKLEAASDSGYSSPIKTVWGVGYKFAPEE